MSYPVIVNVTVETYSPAETARVAEAFSLASSGLALEGIQMVMSLVPVDGETVEEFDA
jgi:hypothetical protein